MKALSSGASLLVFLLGVMPAGAQVRDGCSHDALHVDGTLIEVVLCAPPVAMPRKGEGRSVSIGVVETFAANGTSFARTVPLEFLDSREMSRSIDDVPLDKLGIPKALHLTIGYRPGLVRLEHAMLVPGAISLK